MQRLPATILSPRSGWIRSAWRILNACGVSCLVLVAVAVSTRAQAPIVDPRLANEGASGGVYLPSDRTMSRAMSRAEDWLEGGEYHAALGFLQDVLSREEDAFLDDPGSDTKPTGLKTTARRWIGELPTAGREAYERLQGAAARRELEAALQAGDQQGVAQVVRKYFHTEAGYEGALLLAQINSDRGRHLAGAQLYQELLESPAAAERFEPQLSILAAINHLAAGNSREADEILRNLVKSRPDGEVVIRGQSARIPRAEGDALPWLTRLVGEAAGRSATASDWLTLHGDATRSVEVPGGAPHLRSRWVARVVNNPSLESFLATRMENFEQRGVVAIPAAKPLAVGDTVLIRTPHNLVAVDWETGKRIWETRDEEAIGAETPAAAGGNMVEADQWAPNNPLEQRVWDDALAMSLGSDGERVFVIRGLKTPSAEDAAWQAAPFGGNVGMAIASTNRLASYELASEGKLLWELDGDRPTGKLAGAFFLGAPLAIDNMLYVLAEIRSAVYLLALEPATGELVWQQQLVGLEQGIGLDPQRRYQGVTPSYAGGTLVCPTGAGAVVAIDIVKREFAWVYRYPHRAASNADLRSMLQQQAQGQSPRSNDRWIDGSAMIVDGQVLITPVESGEIHCVDLRSGEFRWKQPRSDALFIGGIDGGVVALVSSDSIRGVKLADGSPAWGETPLALPDGGMPAGLGYVSEGHLYLPLANGATAGIDLREGKIASLTGTDREESLGNLICYRGSVLSQSATVVDKFEQLEVIGVRAQAALAANPNDPVAIRELAELKRVAGDLDESIKLLLRAHELAPSDALVQEMLAEGLLELLRSDFSAHREQLALARRLVRGRDQEMELLRIEARGLEAAGERLGAFEAFVRLLDTTSDQPVEMRIRPDTTVRSDRWINGSLSRLWKSATDEERESILAALADWRPQEDADADQLRAYLACFDFLPDADAARLRLARLLMDGEFLQEAELELLEAGGAADPRHQGESARLMASLLASIGEHRHAASYRSLIEKRWSDLELGDGLTGREWLAKVRRDSERGSRAGRPWPAGQITAAISPVVNSTAPRERIHRGPAQRQFGYRAIRIEQDYGLVPDSTRWFITNESTQLIGRDTMGEEVFDVPLEQLNVNRQYRETSEIHAARLGHLMFISLGGRIMALEARRDKGSSSVEVLWQAFPYGRYATGRQRNRSQNRVDVYHAWSGRQRHTGSGPSLRGIGPATPRGIVLQEQDEVKCVHPLTGELLWSRTGLSAKSELFGDREVIVVVDVDTGTARLLSTIDGHKLGERKLPPFPWTMTAGRNVVFHTTEGQGKDRKLVVRIEDALDGKSVFEATYDVGARLSVVEPNYVAVYDPAGRFQLLDGITGEKLIDQEVEKILRPHQLETMLAGDMLVAMVNTHPLNQLHRPIGPDFPIINGLVYAFSMNDGQPLWAAPAVVRNRGVALAQPNDIPALIFVDRKSTQGASGGGTQLRLMCIDKSTGQTLYRNDELPDTVGSRLVITGEQDDTPGVAVEMSTRRVELAWTDNPRPPAPPSNDDLEAPPVHDERGLWGVGRKIGEALQGAFEKQDEQGGRPRAIRGRQQIQGNIRLQIRAVPQRQGDE